MRKNHQALQISQASEPYTPEKSAPILYKLPNGKYPNTKTPAKKKSVKKPIPKEKQLKIHSLGRSTSKGNKNVPEIRISGNWLESLGFEISDTINLKLSKRKIIITKVKNPS